MILVCIDCSCGLQRESIISELSEVTDRISSRSSANSLMISNTQLSFVRIVFQIKLISSACNVPSARKSLVAHIGGIHNGISEGQKPLYIIFSIVVVTVAMS